jgi:hypothetical protein
MLKSKISFEKISPLTTPQGLYSTVNSVVFLDKGFGITGEGIKATVLRARRVKK